MFWKKGLLGVIAFALLVVVGRQVAADAPDANTSDKESVRHTKIADRQMAQWLERMAADESEARKDELWGAGPERRAKIAFGPNANAMVTIDLITDGGAGNQTDDGVTSGTVSGQGTTIAIEVFATGVTTPLRGLVIRFGFDASVLTFVKAENSAFAFSLPEPDGTGTNFAATSPVTLGSSGFLARAEFTTAVDVTGRTFSIGIATVSLLESNTSKDYLTTTDVIAFNATPSASPDFDSDGTVGIPDFLEFVNHFGTSRGDAGYDAKYDLDGNDAIGIPDFLIFVDSFGKEVPPSGGGATVTIADANLRAVIADSLGKSSGEAITRSEMATLTRLDAPNAGIRSLTGLEHATNLQRLDFGREYVNNERVNSNDISNLSPLSNLTNLTVLDLSDNSISDISAVSNLTNLTVLNLSINSISDISAVSNLTNLTWLSLFSNSISDISAVSNLTNLTWLSLFSNSISDISAVSNLTNLTLLSLRINSISDISAVSNLTNLTWLSLSRNSISDISAVSNLTNLTELYLYSNSISDISAVSNLTNLTELYLYSNSISDISAVSNLTNLTRLSLYSNSISDISAVSNLTNLTDLRLSDNIISDISAVSNLTNLTRLWLSDNIISDISAVSNLTNLTAELYLYSNIISDISAVSNLINLTWLSLSNNSISDISAVSNLTNLTRLFLSYNSISDISAVSNLTNLTNLGLRENSISDISAVSNLTNLTRLSLSSNIISDISAVSNLTNLTNLGLSNNSISDISPLVANTGLGSGDGVDVRNNPLNATSINTHIPILQRRGVNVQFGASKPTVEEKERGIIREEWETKDYISRGRMEVKED